MTPTYGFRIVGPCSGERRLCDAAAAFAAYARCDQRANVEREAYLSAFTFGDDFAEHLRRHGTTKGFTGVCGAAWVWFDIDRPGDLDAATADARALCVNLAQRFALDDGDVLVFFTGSKGYHVGIPTALWSWEPSPLFNRIARRFAEQVADSIEGGGVGFDAGIYDKVRAFRAPNSRHPATGLHKRRLTVDELLHLSTAAIVDMAREPEPFDVPEPSGGDWELSAAWRAAAEHVAVEAEAVQHRRAEGGDGKLNRQTLDFIRDGASVGDRHRLLYSAARNLGDFGCSTALAHALLNEAALDSGLSPSDVRRQIDCGLTDAGKDGAL